MEYFLRWGDRKVLPYKLARSQVKIRKLKKTQNGQDLCSIPRSCYDRRVSKRLFYHFVTRCVTKMASINFLFQHQPPRSSCRCHQGQTWRRFRQGRLQVRLSRWLIVWHNHTVIQPPVHLFWQTNTHLTKIRFSIFSYLEFVKCRT